MEKCCRQDRGKDAAFWDCDAVEQREANAGQSVEKAQDVKEAEGARGAPFEQSLSFQASRVVARLDPPADC